jgi:hypothetical protein
LLRFIGLLKVVPLSTLFVNIISVLLELLLSAQTINTPFLDIDICGCSEKPVLLLKFMDLLKVYPLSSLFLK